jgi:hypothetical protein
MRTLITEDFVSLSGHRAAVACVGAVGIVMPGMVVNQEWAGKYFIKKIMGQKIYGWLSSCLVSLVT